MVEADRALVERKVRQTWPDAFDAVMGMLDRIDVHGASDAVLARVQLAVLMQTDGDRQTIPGLVDMASSDYRDALVGAEYPDQMRWGFSDIGKLDPEEQRAYRDAVTRDRKRYLDWLKKPGV